MAQLQTTNFGIISFLPESVFDFPCGLPGFEERRRFVPVQNPRTAPVVFLQSLDTASLCFPTLPVLVVDPQYRLVTSAQDLEILGFPNRYRPVIGRDVLCLAVLTLQACGPTANLLAPVVVNLKNRRAVQAIAPESSYSHRHALFSAEAALCS